MKKLFITVFALLIGLSALAEDKEDALKFFYNYINAANTYSKELPEMYSDDAKIIRQVITPSEGLVNVPFSIKQYRNQLKLSGKVAKFKKYTNKYTNITIEKVNNGYKIKSYRQPSLGGPKLRTITVVQKQPNGNWLIIKELTQTKEQIFLKYKHNKV